VRDRTILIAKMGDENDLWWEKMDCCDVIDNTILLRIKRYTHLPKSIRTFHRPLLPFVECFVLLNRGWLCMQYARFILDEGLGTVGLWETLKRES
jgi:hypothetical protein